MGQEAESMRNPIPRVVTIHDISGIGRTSLTAAIPVLSSGHTARASSHGRSFHADGGDDGLHLSRPHAEHEGYA